MRRGYVFAASFAALTLAVAGCGSITPAMLAAARTQAPAGLQRFYDQQLHWEPCSPDWAIDSGAAMTAAEAAQAVAGFQCAWLTVPLNYQDPGGTTIRLAMNRLPAADRATRIGPLLTNPGGPGGSGLSFAFGARTWFTAALRARYDIVGMDPRGVGLSSPVNCGLTVKEQEETDPLTAARELAKACERSAGSLIPYVGTDNAARDLDIARAVLGELKLDYYGVSYGTLLGLTYADLFPHETGRMVLDSVDSPTSENNPAEQGEGFEATFMFFVASCVQFASPCPMGATRSAAVANYDAMISRLQSAPLTLSSGLVLTGDTLTGLVSQALYNEAYWRALWKTLGSLINGTPDLARIEALAATFGQGGGDQSYQAIYCLTLRPGQRTVAAARQAARVAVAAAPRFGGLIEGTRLDCALWPVASPANAGQPLHAAGAPVILLVNNVYDPATPLVWAQQVHGDVAGSLLVTNVAGGHGFYPMGPCTHAVVDNFLVSFLKPAPGTVCHDRNPLLSALFIAVTG